jgi:hypothetical protein
MASLTLPNFTKIYQLVQKLLVGGHADKQTGDLISLLSVLESRLETRHC